MLFIKKLLKPIGLISTMALSLSLLLSFSQQSEVQAAVAPTVTLNSPVDVVADFPIGYPGYPKSSQSANNIIATPNGNVYYMMTKNVTNSSSSYTHYYTYGYYDAKTNLSKNIQTDSQTTGSSYQLPNFAANGRYIAYINVDLTYITLYDTQTGVSKIIYSKTGKISNGSGLFVTNDYVIFNGSNGYTLYNINSGVTSILNGTYYPISVQPDGKLITGTNATSNSYVIKQVKLVDISGVDSDIIAYQTKSVEDWISQLNFIDHDNIIFKENIRSPWHSIIHKYNLVTKQDKILTNYNLTGSTIKESVGYLTDEYNNVYSLSADNTVKLTGPNYPSAFTVVNDNIFSGRSATVNYDGHQQIVKYQTTMSSILPPVVSTPLVDPALKNATSTVVKAETTISGGLATQSLIDTAKSDYNTALSLVNALSDSTDKTNLLARLVAVQQTITNAQNVLNASNAVTTANTLSNGDLSTQTLIDSSTKAISDAQALITALPIGTVKTSLQKTLDTNSATVKLAQDTLNATNAVSNVGTLVSADLSTQPLIDTSNKAISDAQALVSKLPDGNIKIGLQNTLNDNTAKVQLAQDILNAKNSVANATTLTIADLSTQPLIDSAKQAIADAQTLVSKLPVGDIKYGLQAQLDIITLKVNIAQATLDVQTAEQAKTQVSVDSANASIAKLSVGDVKTSLTNRIAIVQQYININNGLNSILNGTLNTYVTIDASITTLNTAKISLDTYPVGTDKDTLTVKYQDAVNYIEKALETLLQQKQTGKPVSLSNASLQFMVKNAVKNTGATSINDRGTILGFVMPLLHGKATGKQVNDIIDQYFAN
jgi:hypothetical protein